LAAAKNVARLDVEVALARAELKRSEVRSRVHGAFAAALFFDAARQTHSNNLAGAAALTRMTRARIEAGDALREDLARAEIEELQARADMRAAEAARRLAIGELGAALGSANLEIGSIEGSLHDALALPRIEAALVEIGSSPSVVAAESEAAAQRARVELARKQRIPDINFDLFYRRIQESRQDAFDAGVRIPLPLFTRSRARVREASAEAATVEARVAATRSMARQQLNRGLADLHRAVEVAGTINREVLPRAQLVLTNAEARYKLGDASLADVLQKRRDWNDMQTKYLETLREVHEAWRDLAALTESDRKKR
jgi:cobalt-zinc-cadmium efflux system outer membrane protein